MRRIKHQVPAFVQPKGFSEPVKDAMEVQVPPDVLEKVNDIVTEKAVELVEQKSEEIEKKTDEVLDAAQEKTQEVADKIEKAVEPVKEVLDKLDDNPAVKEVIDTVSTAIAHQVDGREFSCSLFGWLLTLRITRKSSETSPSKSTETPNKPSSETVQSAQSLEAPHPTLPPSSQDDKEKTKQ